VDVHPHLPRNVPQDRIGRHSCGLRRGRKKYRSLRPGSLGQTQSRRGSGRMSSLQTEM
jgi:hypothetical protein